MENTDSEMDEEVRLYRRKGGAARRASRLWRNYLARENFGGPMCGTTVGNFRRMLNKAVSSHVIREASFSLRCRINYGMFTRYDSRFNGVENAAWGKARPWAKRLSWQTQGGRVK
jgi:hypothetical protein